MAFKLKDWITVPWSEVEQDEVVRTADERQWRVRGVWNGSRVLLHPLIPGDGVPVSPSLTDGTKPVEVLRHRPVADVEQQPTTPPRFGPPMTATEQAQQLAPIDPMTPGMPDPCQPIGCDNGIHRPGCTFAEFEEATVPHDEPGKGLLDPALPAAPVWGAPDPVTGTRSGMVPVPKFGQPASDLTAAEQRSTDPADDEGRAVAEMARHGLAPELVSVEEGGKILVPRELDDLALRSHLFLMHGGYLDTEQDVDRAKLSEVHGRLHESECPHQHVNRSELPA